MRQYQVFRHPAGPMDAVKHGWSWQAFLFTFLWAMAKRMYWLGAGVLAGAIALGLLIDASGADQRGNETMFFVAIVNGVLFGLDGSWLRRRNLVSRGFEVVDTVAAKDRASAIALRMNTDQSHRTDEIANKAL